MESFSSQEETPISGSKLISFSPKSDCGFETEDWVYVVNLFKDYLSVIYYVPLREFIL